MSVDPARDASLFPDLLGIRREEWRDGAVRLVLELGPRHLNRSGTVHGGVLLAMLDEAGAAPGLWTDEPGRRRASVTVDLDCRFVGRADSGRLVATGTLLSGGRSLYFSRSEVRDGAGRLLAFGASTHRWRRGDAPAA